MARGEQGILRVGLAAAIVDVTSGVLNQFSRRLPDVELQVRQGTFGDPSAGLVAGDVDVALVWGPYSGDGQQVRVLRTDPRLVASSPAGVVELVAAGQGIALLPSALAGAIDVFGLRAVPVPDIAPCQIAVALPAEPGPAALAFAEIAAEVTGAIARG